jgi:hypothetical protein
VEVLALRLRGTREALQLGEELATQVERPSAHLFARQPAGQRGVDAIFRYRHEQRHVVIGKDLHAPDPFVVRIRTGEAAQQVRVDVPLDIHQIGLQKAHVEARQSLGLDAFERVAEVHVRLLLDDFTLLVKRDLVRLEHAVAPGLVGRGNEEVSDHPHGWIRAVRRSEVGRVSRGRSGAQAPNGRLRKREPASPNRQGASTAFEMPMRGPATTSTASSGAATKNGGRSSGNP